MITNPTQLNALLYAFLEVLNRGYEVLQPSANWLLVQFGQWYLLMAVIAILMRATHPGEVLAGFLLALLKFLFYQLLVVNWRTLCDGFIGALMAMGLMVGNSQTPLPMGPDDIFDIGRIIGTGWRAMSPFMNYWQRVSSLWDLLGVPADFIIFGLVIIVSLVAFLVLASQIFAAMIEFKIITVLAEPLLAFGLFHPTQFIAEAVVKGTVAGAVRLGAVALVISIVVPLINTLSLPPATVPTYWIALNTLAGAVMLVLAGWKAPNYAASLLGGVAAQAAGDLFALIGSIGYGTMRGVRAVTART